MAGSITMALHTAKDGLLAMQSALGTVSQNVANVNTPGYSRKIQTLETRVLAGSGAGVQLSDVTRNVDEGLLKDVRTENETLAAQEAELKFYQRIEDLFGTPGDNTSIAHMMNQLNTTLESLSKSPNRSVEQGEFVLTAVDVVEKLQTMSQEIQDLRLQADIELSDTVTEINSLLSEIASLNDKIIRNQTTSNDVTDLQDKRDLALNELSKLIDIQYFERETGEVAVFTKSGRVLVDSDANTMSHTPAASVGPLTTHSEGNFTGIYVSANVSANDITNDIIGGQAAGLINIRDGFLNDVQREIDELTQVLRDTVNEVHNAGSPVPGRTSMTGSRTFLKTAGGAYDQRIEVTGQVRFMLTDSNGDQVATDTYANIMATAGAASPQTIDEITSALDTWLSNAGYAGATVQMTNEGKLEINMNNSSTYFHVFDESSTTAGEQSNSTIKFYGTGTTTHNYEEVQGFSNFFGLNDFYVTNQPRDIWESDVLSSTTTMNAGTLYFYDESTGVGLGNEFGTLTVQPGWSLQEFVDAINNNTDLNQKVTASLIPEGNGQRIRVLNNDGKEMFVGGSPSNAIDDIGWHESEAGMSQELVVREDIKAAPGLVSTAQFHFDTNIGVAGGEYRLLDTDNTNVLALANAMTATQSFDASGSMVSRNQSLSDYATNMIGEIASTTKSLSSSQDSQKRLVDSLTAKSDNLKGVNLDEELSQLIMFEQAYAASARVISTIKEMFDTLEQAVG